MDAPDQLLLILIILLSILLSACKPAGETGGIQKFSIPVESLLEDTYPVDPTFEEFYTNLGGVGRLGPAISPVIDSGSLKTQYIQAALMIYDPLAAEDERYRLASLGLIFGIAEPAILDPGPLDKRYEDGHIIYEEFAPLYDELGGRKVVGRPLTEARYNPDKGRVEQYFENLGFYRLDQDPLGTVKLLAYGAFACDLRCRYQPSPNSIPSLRPVLPEPFGSQAARLGFLFTGRTLSEPYLAPDGKLEVIFENLVMVTEPEEVIGEKIQFPFRLLLPLIFGRGDGIPEAPKIQQLFQIWLPLVFGGGERKTPSVSLRPIVEMVGVRVQLPVDPIDSPLMVFYPIEGNKGRNLPLYFDEYLRLRGGLEVTGPPITEVFPVREGVFRQCFTNLCLDFDIQATGIERLSPAPLGEIYKEQFYRQSGEFIKSQTLDNLRMQVSESNPYVDSRQPQEIFIEITENSIPLKNREPRLTLTLPDGNRVSYPFPPTNEKGVSSLRLPPIAAPSGTLLLYEVCLAGIEDKSLCIEDNYLIWNSLEGFFITGKLPA